MRLQHKTTGRFTLAQRAFAGHPHLPRMSPTPQKTGLVANELRDAANQNDTDSSRTTAVIALPSQ